jgi:Ca-activated chloride channel homolog
MTLYDQKKILSECLICCFLLIVLAGFHWWDPLAKWTERGNKALEEGNVQEAERAYSDASESSPGDERILHNKALLAYLEEEFENAAKLFDRAATSQDRSVRAQSLYNRGNAYMQQGHLQKAAESFIEALKVNPADEDSKINLESVLRLMEQMPTPTPAPQEMPNEDQDSDDDKQGDQEEQTDDLSTDSEQPNDVDQDHDMPTETPTPDISSPPETENDMPTPTPLPDGLMSRPEAERLLDAQQQEEMDVLRRLHQLPQATDIEKRW